MYVCVSMCLYVCMVCMGGRWLGGVVASPHRGGGMRSFSPLKARPSLIVGRVVGRGGCASPPHNGKEVGCGRKPHSMHTLGLRDVCMHVCMRVCMHACMHACVCVYVCMWMCVFVYACLYACMYACMHS